MNRKDYEAIRERVAEIRRMEAVRQRVKDEVGNVGDRTRVDGYFY